MKAQCTGSVTDLLEWLLEVVYEQNTKKQEKLCIVLFIANLSSKRVEPDEATRDGDSVCQMYALGVTSR